MSFRGEFGTLRVLESDDWPGYASSQHEHLTVAASVGWQIQVTGTDSDQHVSSIHTAQV